MLIGIQRLDSVRPQWHRISFGLSNVDVIALLVLLLHRWQAEVREAEMFAADRRM